MQYVFGILMTLTATFLILLVLVQRGRGGGLAGAFGGMGGQSAFGTKAGDTFTKMTIIASVFWLLLCIASVRFLGTSTGAFGRATPPSRTQLVPNSTDTPLLPESTSSDPSEVPALPALDQPPSDTVDGTSSSPAADAELAPQTDPVLEESEVANPASDEPASQ